VEGKLRPDNRFVAEQVQAKCASKYEAAPGQSAVAPQPAQSSNTATERSSTN
jgi:cytochrome c-type biogenesis protein CcmE